MEASAGGIARAALLSFGISFVLLILFGVMADSLGAAGVSPGVVQVVGLVLGILARFFAGYRGGRATCRNGGERTEALLTGLIGCAIGFVVLELANAFFEVALLGRTLSMDWSMLYGILPWVAEGAAGGFLAALAHRRVRERVS